MGWMLRDGKTSQAFKAPDESRQLYDCIEHVGGLKMLSMDIIALHLLNVGFSYIEHQTYADMKHHICFDFRHNISHFEYI